MKTYQGPCDCDDKVAHDASQHALMDTLADPAAHHVHYADFRMSCRGHSDMVKGVKHWYDAIREHVQMPEGAFASFAVHAMTSTTVDRVEPEEMPAELAWASRLLMSALNDDPAQFHALIESERALSAKELNKKLSLFLYVAAWVIATKAEGDFYMIQHLDGN